MEDINSQSTQNDLYYNKYIKKHIKSIYNKDNAIEKDNMEDFICPICLNILKDPISCSSNKNAHSFCKECIDQYLEGNNKCPTCKINFEYKKNNELNNSLNKLSFECLFKKEGCNDILSYSEYLNHINNCKYDNDIEYECNIQKYNYDKKEFVKCGYIENKINIEQHFKKCGLSEYKCLFCDKNILQMDIEKHATNECKIKFEKYPNGDKYLGEKKNNLKEGYGKYFYANGRIYAGPFKNDKKEGFGLEKYSNGDGYVGEFKNDLKEGIGLYSFYNLGTIYQGEFKNDMREGIGIKYFNDEIRYIGEFKNNQIEGYGCEFYSDGSKYMGEFKNNMREGFGICYYSNGGKYIGMHKNNKRDGKAICYYFNGDKYKGNYKQDKRDGYGILYLSSGSIYEGEFKDNYYDGYGIFKYSHGDIYEGEFKKSKMEGRAKISSKDGNVYIGEFTNNMEKGFGIVYTQDGDSSEGEFRNGVFYTYIDLEAKRYERYLEFKRSISLIYIIYKYLPIILKFLYPRLKKNKMTLLLIIILLFVILIN